MLRSPQLLILPSVALLGVSSVACDSDIGGPTRESGDVRDEWAVESRISMMSEPSLLCRHSGTLVIPDQDGEQFAGALALNERLPDPEGPGNFWDCGDLSVISEAVTGTISTDGANLVLVVGSLARMGKIIETITGCDLAKPVDTGLSGRSLITGRGLATEMTVDVDCHENHRVPGRWSARWTLNAAG